MPEVSGTIPSVIAETQGVSATADQPTTADGRERRDWWVAALRREGAAFATAAQAADPDDDVPTCPGWTVRRLVAHLGRVHRTATAGVLDGTVEPPALAARPPADDSKMLAWYAEGLEKLLQVFTDAEPHLDDFWPRRMAHDTTVHRFDAELAAYAKAGGFDAALAADGVGEVVESMLQLRAGDEPLASARGDVLPASPAPPRTSTSCCGAGCHSTRPSRAVPGAGRSRSAATGRLPSWSGRAEPGTRSARPRQRPFGSHRAAAVRHSAREGERQV